MFDLSDSLGIVVDSTYDETKRSLTEYFAPQRDVAFEVFVFRQVAQASKETLDTYRARFKQLSKNCSFYGVHREIKSHIIQKSQLSTGRGSE